VAASSPTSTAERQELIEEYVENAAMSEVLHVLIGNVGIDDSRYAAACFYGPPWTDLIVRETDPYIQGDDYLEKLWPDDENLEGAEFQAVERRANALAAQLLAAIVANPDYLVRRAAWLLERVAANAQKAGA
jgi:hypothetical protein